MPSVKSITTLDCESLSFNLLTELASPNPIAVPSSTIPKVTSFNKFNSTLWSVVSGHCVKLSPANITNPILSFCLSVTNSAATFLAAVNLSGVRSCASIEPDISTANTMSIPCDSVSCHWLIDCGRANTIITNAIVITLSANGKWRRYTFSVRGISLKAFVDANLKDACMRDSFTIYHAMSGKSNNNKYK